MKKIVLAVFITGLSYGSINYAGEMGAASDHLSKSNPYLGLEGSYTWTSLGSYTLNRSTAVNTNHLWGGRFSIGMMRNYSQRLRFNAEVGGGYYGNTGVQNTGSGVTTQRSIDGYDILLGAYYNLGDLYNLSHFDIFGDVGFMVENYRYKLQRDYETMIPGGLFQGLSSTDNNQTQALPELKVGGVYNINENLGISLSYLHVFGSSVGGNSELSGAPDNIVINLNLFSQNPTLNTILLGLHYNII